MIRPNLKNLSDNELAARFERVLECYDEADKERRSKSFFWKTRRTEDVPVPARQLIAFRASPGFRFIYLAALTYITDGLVNWIKPPKAILISDAVIAADDAIVEMQRITKEIERRVEQRKKAS